MCSIILERMVFIVTCAAKHLIERRVWIFTRNSYTREQFHSRVKSVIKASREGKIWWNISSYTLVSNVSDIYIINENYYTINIIFKKYLKSIALLFYLYLLHMDSFLHYVLAFECNKCQKAFSAKSSLQAHLNTHRREPPQSCVECNRVFIRQDCLMRHIRAKHRELLEDVMNEVEKKHLQTQLFKIASIADAKTKTGESKRLSTDELLKAIIDLLRILIDEETLQV